MQNHKLMLISLFISASCFSLWPTDITIQNKTTIEHNEITNIAINLQNIKKYEIYGKLKVDIKQILQKLGRASALEYLETLSTYALERQFLKAILKDDYELVELFIEAGISVNQEIDGRLPLVMAIKKNKPNACKALIDANADLHIGFNSGASPLSYSNHRSFEDIATYLVKKGANLGNNAIDYIRSAINKNQMKLLEALLEKGITISATYWDIIEKIIARPDILRIFLKHSLDPNMKVQYPRDIPQQSLLFIALRLNQYDSVKYLLEAGANTNARNCSKQTPLQYAIISKQEKVIDLLKAHGAK